MINFHNYYETQQPNRKEIESEISGFLVKIDNILTIRSTLNWHGHNFYQNLFFSFDVNNI